MILGMRKGQRVIVGAISIPDQGAMALDRGSKCAISIFTESLNDSVWKQDRRFFVECGRRRL